MDFQRPDLGGPREALERAPLWSEEGRKIKTKTKPEVIDLTCIVMEEASHDPRAGVS